MTRKKDYDPLDAIPRPEFVRERLNGTLALADRLRLLLDLAEKVHQDAAAPAAPRQVVAVA